MHPAPAETIALRMKIDPACAAEYRRRHDSIWPELAAQLIAAGVIDYRIFLDPATGCLFAVLSRDADHRMAALADNPVMRRWWAMMEDLMPRSPDGGPWSAPLEEVFHLAAPGAAPL
jgi:L-rhamnose mutarotase